MFCPGKQAAASPVHLREAARAVAAQRVDQWLGAVVPPVPLPAAHEQTGMQASCGFLLADWHWQPLGFGSPQACELQAASTLALLTAEAMGAASDTSISSETDDSDSSEDGASRFGTPAEGCPPGLPAAGAPPQDLGLQFPLTRLLSDLGPGANQHRHNGCSCEQSLAGLVSQHPQQLAPCVTTLERVGAAALCRVLLVMAAQYPSALEGLLLYALPPAAAEVLLRKLEAGGHGHVWPANMVMPASTLFLF
jgi:hypothetical protein